MVVGDDSLDAGDEVYVSVDYNLAVMEADDFEQAIATGAQVVVFAHSTSDARELVADIEGFMTACDGAKPIGARGTVGAWPNIDCLDQVLRLATED